MVMIICNATVHIGTRTACSTNPSGFLKSSEKYCSARGNSTLCESEGEFLRSEAGSQSRRESKGARERRRGIGERGSGRAPERLGARKGNCNGA